MKPIAVFDTECYRNYFLAAFLDTETGKVKCIEQREGVPLDVVTIRKILKRYTVVGFNSLNYDLPILSAAIAGGHDLKNLSDGIIKFRLKAWQFYDKYEVKQYPCDMIDLIEVAPGMGSLKVYGARLHSKTLWDLPYNPDEILTDAQIDEIREYCVNDLQTTLDLWNYLQPQIKLREQMSRVYDVDLRSKSDAQIAEAVIKKLLKDKHGVWAKKPALDDGYTFKYVAPKYLKGKLNGLVDEVEAITFKLSDKGSVETPDALKDKVVEIGQSKYRMGIGGLHSSETCMYVDSGYSADVASYYPSMIIVNKYYPPHLGEAFLRVYRDIYNERIAAKKSGDKVRSDIMKITLNGTFGKLGNKYSIFYSPDMLIQVTLTGQLTLLMLIEELEACGVSVMSANTDGIITDKDPSGIIKKWEVMTGLSMEIDPIQGLWARDVNSYVMLMGGKVKTKGAYALDGLAKNPHADIVIKSVIDYLTQGLSIESTVKNNPDVRKFLFTRKVEGGANKDDKYLGRVVRWYYAMGEKTPIVYAENGNKVSESEGGKPLMTLPDTFPDDVDYERYIEMGYETLKLIGVNHVFE